MHSSSGLQLFSVFHKPYAVALPPYISPIQVGAALAREDLGFLKDNTGDHISAKNPVYCELTALYWIWKNLDQVPENYIGLVHYRRYLFQPGCAYRLAYHFRNRLWSRPRYYAVDPEQTPLKAVFSDDFEQQVQTILQSGKIILPRSISLRIDGLRTNIRNHYIYYHISEDWQLFKETVLDLYPEYQATFERMEQTKRLHPYNMFIADKAFVHAYCSWLFAILAELEKKIKLSGYPYQQRVLGFLAERMLNLFVLHHQYPVKEMPILFLA